MVCTPADFVGQFLVREYTTTIGATNDYVRVLIADPNRVAIIQGAAGNGVVYWSTMNPGNFNVGMPIPQSGNSERWYFRDFPALVQGEWWLANFIGIVDVRTIEIVYVPHIVS